jgi:hypothetical protein
MGIPSISGESGADPVPDIQENEKVIGVEKAAGDALEIFPQRPQIYNTQSNNTTLHMDTDVEIISAIKGYVEGTPIKVDYYHQIQGNATDNSNVSIISFLADSVNTSYLRIVNMEIRLKEPMTFNYNTEVNTSEVTTTAVTYPGFNPRAGDMFVYSIDNGTTGLFKVNTIPERLAISNQTAYQFSCILVRILDTNDLESIMERVRETAYFNKKRFLSENTALLTHQEVVDLDYINKSITELIDHYGAHFYSPTDKSIWRPDAKYDPYMVAFVHKAIGRYLDKRYTMQLFEDVTDKIVWRQSLYYKLLARDNLSDLLNTASVRMVEYSAYSSVINGLVNRDAIVLDPDGDIDYMNTNIISLDSSTYTDFDKVVSLLLRYGVIAYETVKSMIVNIRSEDPLTQFYQIPILIYIMKMMKSGIETGKAVNYTIEDVPVYVDINFTSLTWKEANLESRDEWDTVSVVDDTVPEPVLIIETNGASILGIITNDGTVLYPNSADIIMVGTIATIDMHIIMQEYAITEIEGLWKVVTTNAILG